MNGICAEVVMLVDDNEIDLFINQKIIEFNSFSNKLITLSSGQEGLDFLTGADESDIPDLIFLDLNMPLVDGFKFLTQFSKLPENKRKKCSIVILSSSNNPDDKEKVEVNEEVILFLSKPLDDSKLETVKEVYARHR